MSYSQAISILLPFVLACGIDGHGSSPDAAVTTDAASDATPQPTKRASLDVQLIPDGFGSNHETLIEGAFVASDGGCLHEVIENCEVRRCQVGANEVLAAPGKLHVVFPAGGGEFGWDPGNFPVMFSANAIPWAAGELVQLRSDGEDVPPVTLSAASPRTLDAGFTGPLFNETMTRASLPVTWTATSGEVVVTLRQDARTDRPRTSISCKFAATTGGSFVPAAAIQRLDSTPAASSLGDVRVRAWLATTSTVTAGDYAVRLRVLRGFSDQYKLYRLQ